MGTTIVVLTIVLFGGTSGGILGVFGGIADGAPSPSVGKLSSPGRTHSIISQWAPLMGYTMKQMYGMNRCSTIHICGNKLR